MVAVFIRGLIRRNLCLRVITEKILLKVPYHVRWLAQILNYRSRIPGLLQERNNEAGLSPITLEMILDS